MSKMLLSKVGDRLFPHTKIPYVDGLEKALEGISPDFSWGNVVGDGVTDDYAAIQEIFNNSDGVVSFPCKKFFVSQSIIVDLSKVHHVKGNGASIIINGDYTAISLVGSMVSPMTADKSTVTNDIFYNQGGVVMEGLKIYSTDVTKGTGISISGCYKPIVSNNYIVNLNKGIRISGRNRDVIITDNNIHHITTDGILFDSSVNTHQVNILGNQIAYCRNCINADRPSQLANVQIVGNDIEVASYPTGNSSLCIRLYGYNAPNYNNGFFSEFEICGNTIQGHEANLSVMDFDDVINLSMSGNHMGNCSSDCIKLNKVFNAAISGNSFRNVAGACFYLSGTSDNITIVGNSGHNNTAMVKSASSAVLSNLVISSNVGKACSNIANLSMSNGQNIKIDNNVMSGNGGVVVSASTLDYISVIGNMVKGSAIYNVGDCTHRLVDNNI